MTMTTTDPQPYKGAAPFAGEDGMLFFGREREAELALATVLAARTSMLYARSGAGKTSLLAARVLPRLELGGRTPIPVRLGDDPIAATRAATLASILPPPVAEARVLTAAAELLAPGEPLALDALLERFDALDTAARARRRELLAPVDGGAAPAGLSFAELGTVLPHATRLLRATIDVAAFAEHLATLAPELFAGGGAVTGSTPATELATRLASPGAAAAHARILARLDLPLPGLRSFFERLFEVYGAHRARFEPVLVFDQFEELFTRFVDPGPTPRRRVEARDWRQRHAFLAALAELTAPAPPERPGDVRAALPRLVFSLRQEWLADLDPIRRFVPRLDEDAYHLEPLTLEGARRAIAEPARIFGRPYDEGWVDELLRQLAREERWVEPGHLAIVCERVWRERAAGPDDAAAADDDAILDRLGGVEGILDGYLREHLAALSTIEWQESLELLSRLVTPGGTRNIESREALIGEPPRDVARRAALLDRLEDRRLVRVEKRLGGRFVEITHEFLIGPILAALDQAARRDPLFARLPGALESLRGALSAADDDPGRSPLTLDAHRVLHHGRERLAWDGRGAEVMLRAAILLGREPEVVEHWAGRVAEGGRESVGRIAGSALAEDRPEVRDRLARALAGVGGEDRRRAVLGRLHRGLEDDDRRAAANQVLAVLAGAGWATRPALSFGARLRLARRARPTLARRPGVIGEAVGAGFAASVAGALFPASLMLASLPDLTRGETPALIVTGAALGALFAFFAARGSRPVMAYFERPAGVAVESVASALGALLPGVGLLVAVFWAGKGLGGARVPLVLALGAAALLAASARTGVYLARRRGRVPRILAGGGAGILTLTAAVAFLRRLTDGDPQTARFAAVCWLLLLPAAFGVAAAFDRVEASVGDGGVGGRWIAAVAALALAGLWLVLWLGSRRPEPAAEIAETLAALPAAREIEVRETSRLIARLEPASATTADVVLWLCAGARLIERADAAGTGAAPEILETGVTPGRYRLVAARYGEESCGGDLLEIADRLAPVAVAPATTPSGELRLTVSQTTREKNETKPGGG